MTMALMHSLDPPWQISAEPTRVLCVYMPKKSFPKYLKNVHGREETDSRNWNLEVALSGPSSPWASPVPPAHRLYCRGHS